MIRLYFLICHVLISFCVKAQYYDNDIKAFQKMDSIKMPKKNSVLLIGSSSFTNWKEAQNYFPKHNIINRAFGGSTLLDQLYYVKEVVFPYKPKIIYIYCGENDIASADTVSARTVLGRFIQLYKTIRTKYPRTKINYISMKPSPSRWEMKDRLMEGNTLIKAFLAKEKHVKYIDIWNKMLNTEGMPREDLFLEDMLHMNAKGYEIWAKKMNE